MQIDSAIEFVLLIVESHGCLLFSFSGLMIWVRATYTVELKGATSSGIFPVENGPQFACRRPEKYQGGLIVLTVLTFTQGHNKYDAVAADPGGYRLLKVLGFRKNLAFTTCSAQARAAELHGCARHGT